MPAILLPNSAWLLTRILRLPQPLDVFVWPSEEKNASCLPSCKGNRLSMCLYSGLVASLNSQELLFSMGHEVGHALLNHGQTLGVSFANPHFSSVEVVRLRATSLANQLPLHADPPTARVSCGGVWWPASSLDA